MAKTAEHEDHVDDLPEDQADQHDMLEDDPLPEDEDGGAIDDAQAEAAEERKEGGYR